LAGKSELVKPNVVSGSPVPTTTDPELVVVDAGRIMYAGGPWRGDEDRAGLLLVSSDGNRG
jgi:uncharacterized protein (DUF362 family)